MMRNKKSPFNCRQFTAAVILWAVRWYRQFPISCPDLERMLADRGVAVDHTIIFRWNQAYAPELDKRLPAVDPRGQTIDFLLGARRDAATARRFFRKALKQARTVNPRTLTVDKNAAYPSATKAMKNAGELWRFTKLRLRKYLNNIVEQDHRCIKRLVRPGRGFKSFRAAHHRRVRDPGDGA